VLENKEKKIAENKRKNQLISKYGKEIGTLIIENKIKIGMTKQMAKLSWGEPDQIHKDVFATHEHEQWVYGNGNYLYRYIRLSRTIKKIELLSLNDKKQ